MQKKQGDGARALDADIVRITLQVIKFIDVDAVARIADDVEQKGAFALLGFRRASTHNHVADEIDLFFVCKGIKKIMAL